MSTAMCDVVSLSYGLALLAVDRRFSELYNKIDL